MFLFGKQDSDFLHNTRVTFENIQDNPEVKTVLLDFGYDEPRIQSGLVVHGEAEQSFRNMVEKRRKRKAASDKMKEQLQIIWKLYIGHLNQLRGELADDPATMSELALNVQRKRSIAGFIEEFSDFYNASLGAEMAAKILPFGFTPEVAIELGDRHVGARGRGQAGWKRN